MSASDRRHNRRTVAAYEGYARGYAAAVPSTPSEPAAADLRRFAAALAPRAQVLEIGSGPGWDADFLETLGVQVRRTDVTAAFLRLQIERGKAAYPLDLLTDAIDTVYDGIVMLYVVQHFEREQLDGVLAKLARALAANGAMLLSHMLGDGEEWEGDAGDYRVVRWTAAAFDERLARAGFAVEWESFIDSERRPWRSVFARRVGALGFAAAAPRD
ncbi:methyltransferase domain-containing protein [Lysobacter enzymogenes]|uniref:methyltransferase domain-containing protein n=1 Tax=Lysobacter enzymogenes TaxID=69 RepID=UPI0019D234C5|nr:methyltransferase domain-containing protein [Lysobacter enzymogenes]